MSSSAESNLSENVDSKDRCTGATRRIFVVALTLLGLLLSINQTFNLRLLAGAQLLDTAYFYLIVGLFLGVVFLMFPGPTATHRFSRGYDWVLALAGPAIAVYFAVNSEKIIQQGWDIIAPPLPTAAAAALCALSLEAVRRTGNLVLCLICAAFFIFPLFADQMPGFLWGPPSNFMELLRQHALGTESIIGVPIRVVAGTLFGFLIFGSALVVTGGGEFFMSFATALLGRSRGGPAKVAIISSGLFGSLSGSVISNVVTTGQLTIPTMKRIGYPATYAAAIEACSSTGGALMPPVMGAVAFIMAEFLSVPYSTVMVAAIVPAFLFYLALILQADNFAARAGLKGQAADDIPDLATTLREGWHFIFSLAFLVFLLLTTDVEARAPYYATVALLVGSLFDSRQPLRLGMLLDIVIDAGRNIAGIVGLLVGIGMIVGSLSYTGVGGAFSRELLQYANGNLILLLGLGAATSFILGMGMTASACYIFLATVLAPALIGMGLDPVASHLFILYWGMLSFITPPVALAALAAAGIAKSPAVRTGFLAMRLGLINFLLPFLFVLSPTLILHGAPLDILHDVVTAVIAVWLVASAFERWLYFVGPLNQFTRALLLVSAGAMLFPGLKSDVFGLLILASVYLASRLGCGAIFVAQQPVERRD